MKTDIDRNTFEKTLLANGVSEVATGNLLRRFDEADNTREGGATEKVVKEAFRIHKIGVKTAQDNKAAAGGDNKGGQKTPAPQTKSTGRKRRSNKKDEK